MMKTYNINIFSFAETNLAWLPHIESTAKYYGRKVFQQFSIVTCSINNPTERAQQPGGVCMGVTRKTVGRVVETEKDPTG
eukprot:15366019-Ditylum_brightwellii.AAC.2